MTKRTAFIRCWNEEKTIIACLMSLEEVFTDYVIIHSDITDNTLSLIENYVRGRSSFIIEKYPFNVYPAHHDIYKTGNYLPENSLAGYYNFGMKICKKVGGIVAKIDCDQVYIPEVLAKQIRKVEAASMKDSSGCYKSPIWGINSFVHDNKLYAPKAGGGINGMMDHFIHSENSDIRFIQSPFFEIAQMPSSLKNLSVNSTPAWFHFMKRAVGVDKTSSSSNPVSFIQTIDEYILNKKEFMFLGNDLAALFEEKIRPLLEATESPFRNIQLN